MASINNLKIEKFIKGKKDLKFLILRMKPVGDTILTTPLIYVLRSRFPGSQISVVVFSKYVSILKSNPYCDEVIAYDKKKPLKFLFMMLTRKFDVSLDIMNNPRTSQISLFAWAKYRIGLPKPRNFFYNIKVNLSENKNIYIVDKNLKMLHPLGIVNPYYEYFYKPDELSRQFAGSFLNKIHNIEKIVGINISGNSPVQKWPAERFIELGRRVINETDSIVLIFWGPRDKDYIEGIQSKLEGIDKLYVLPDTSLNQMGAFIKECSIFITGDGGPKHMAVASNIPTLTIFGGVNWVVWNPEDFSRFPYLKPDIECYPCDIKKYCRLNTIECLKSITVDTVFNSAKELMN